MGLPEKSGPHHSAQAAELGPPAYTEHPFATQYSAQEPPFTGAEKQQSPPEYSNNQHIGNLQPPPSASGSRNLRFPSLFNVYVHFSTFTLGSHKDDKLFTVIMTGLRKPMALVQGPDKKAPPLSTIKMKGMGGTSVLTVLPHEGGEISEPLEITIENHSSKHCFCIALPNTAPQFFEWRSSKSEEVQALGAYKRGWKLVWLRGRGEEGKGDEIVAASALNNSLSMKKGLKFGFFNAGLDGSLGDTFQIAAVTTAMNDFEVYVSTNVAIAGNASSAASSALVAASAV